MATNDETYIPYGALRSGRVCALAVDGKEYIVYDISRALQVVCCEENEVEVEGFFSEFEVWQASAKKNGSVPRVWSVHMPRMSGTHQT
jgi:hypothetical protein